MQKEKEWPSADSRALITGVKPSFCGGFQEGKQNQKLDIENREGERLFRPQFLPGM